MNAKVTPTPARPLPSLQGYSGEFYGWCGKQELRFQRCGACETFRHPPRPLCPNCQSSNAQWVPVSGKGKVHTWTTVRQALHPGLAADVPYAGVIVELDEGMRIASWVTDIAPEKLQAGLRVQVWFDAISDGFALPKFRVL